MLWPQMLNLEKRNKAQSSEATRDSPGSQNQQVNGTTRPEAAEVLGLRPLY